MFFVFTLTSKKKYEILRKNQQLGKVSTLATIKHCRQDALLGWKKAHCLKRPVVRRVVCRLGASPVSPAYSGVRQHGGADGLGKPQQHQPWEAGDRVCASLPEPVPSARWRAGPFLL